MPACSRQRRGGRQGRAGITSLSVVIGWVLYCYIFELLYHRTHDLFVSCRSWRYIENFQLLLLDNSANSTDKRMGVVFCPKIDVEGVQAEEEFPLVSRISIGKAPMMLWIFNG